MPEEDFMIYLDDALSKIVSRLPSVNKKSALNSMLIPFLSKVKDESIDQTIEAAKHQRRLIEEEVHKTA